MRSPGSHPYRGRSKSRKFAAGKRAWSLCDRCGFRFLYTQISWEAGTNIRVCRTCNDGAYNRVDHPQRGTIDATDSIGLENPRPDRMEPVPTFEFYVNDEVSVLDDNPGGVQYAVYASVLNPEPIDP